MLVGDGGGGAFTLRVFMERLRGPLKEFRGEGTLTAWLRVGVFTAMICSEVSSKMGSSTSTAIEHAECEKLPIIQKEHMNCEQLPELKWVYSQL
jgi:hypothetical protein